MGLILGILDSSTAAAAAGDFESIATVSVGSGGAASVTFSSIPATYTHLQVRGIQRAVDNVSGDHPYIRVNNDTATNYSWHRLSGSGTTATAAAASTQDEIRYGYNTADGSYSSSVFTGVIIDIFDYAHTNKYKTFRFLSGADNNGSGYVDFESGLWQSTSAITRIDLAPFQGNFAQYSHFALYGIKGA